MHGSVFGKRTMTEIKPTSRRRCPCGCGNRATHTGRGNGIALVIGCQMAIRRWVRDGIKARSARAKESK
jgi:hypothetical protein